MRLLLCLLLLLSAAPARAAGLTVFAAASLTNMLEELGGRWRAAGRGELRFAFAASSILARQIEQGADADLFFAADEAWMDYLDRRGLVARDTRRNPLGNRLVLVARPERAAPVALAPGLDLAALLGPGGRIAAGDPAHVPAGRYAQQALETLGLWNVAAPRLARALNVRAALALVERGEAPYGIVYATDVAATPGLQVVGTFPADSHPPISYPAAVVKARDGAAARLLLDHLTGSEARPIYEKHGFVLR